MRNKRFNLLLVSLVLAVACIFSGCLGNAEQVTEQTEQNELNVYFIDVGQADSTLIMLNGHSMLIDAGNTDDGGTVTAFLSDAGVTSLDYVVCTHAHEDHAGGLADVLDDFTVKKIFAPVESYDSSCYKKFTASAEKQCGITIAEAGMTFELSDAHAEILWPKNTETLDTNNTSITVRLTYGNASFLFTGDIEKESESEIVASGAELSANVLKVAHHGSSTSTSYNFLRNVLPQFAVISCGTGNSYGHPHSETLEILEQAEAQIIRTDKVGTIRFATDGKNITAYYGSEKVTVEAIKNTPALNNTDYTDDGIGGYVGNKNSLKYHLPTCASLPDEANRVYFTTKDEAEQSGYEPCGRCNP